LAEQKGSPAALTTRHQIIEWNYFRPAMQGTFELRLMTEPDPVRVADPRSHRLMTERDLVGLVNIRNFARSEGDPVHTELSRRELDRLAAELNRLFGPQSKERLPQFFSETAAFWTGVRQKWPQLSPEEKALARAYANKTWRIRLPAEMFGKLWGLNPRAALSRHADDVGARITMITLIGIEVSNLPILMDKIFPP
jgi:hypothetical protein